MYVCMHVCMYVCMYVCKSLNTSTGHQTMFGKKIELCPTKSASQRTQLWSVKSKKTKNFKVTSVLKFKHLVSIDLSCSAFSSDKHSNRQVAYAVLFIFKARRVWVKRFYTLFFLPCFGQLLLWKNFISHYIVLKF